MRDSAAGPDGSALSEGLGPLVASAIAEAKLKAYGTADATNALEGDYGTWDDWAALVGRVALQAVAAERERINELLRTHQGVSLETLEYLETMRQGPTAEEWAELDRNARA